MCNLVECSCPGLVIWWADLKFVRPWFTDLFVRHSLEGTILVERMDANRGFYGSHPSSGHSQRKDPLPEVASQMCEVIGAVDSINESDFPDTSCVLTVTG